MVLKWSANLSFMFQESSSLLQRYSLAAKAGFQAVECAFPYEQPLERVVAAQQEAGVQQVLINIHVGDVSKGDLGTAALPGREDDFKKSLDLAIQYAKGLKCTRIHVMSGAVQNPTAEHARTYEQNVRYASSLLASHGIMALIEPINTRSVPNYFMSSYDRALELIQSDTSNNLRLMLDVFHLQQLQGNLTHNIRQYLPYVGHVQVAQVPDRHEPNSTGEVNFAYVFSLLEQLGYDQWIGLEYKPLQNTIAGLDWLQEFGYHL